MSSSHTTQRLPSISVLEKQDDILKDSLNPTPAENSRESIKYDNTFSKESMA